MQRMRKKQDYFLSLVVPAKCLFHCLRLSYIDTTTSHHHFSTHLYFFSTTMTEFRITGIYVLVSTTRNPHFPNNASH